MKQETLLEGYLEFKELCVKMNIVDISEIIKLFEVWLNLLG
jgi:hypothetical protein